MSEGGCRTDGIGQVEHSSYAEEETAEVQRWPGHDDRVQTLYDGYLLRCQSATSIHGCSSLLTR
jgi:hypothetical protein